MISEIVTSINELERRKRNTESSQQELNTMFQVPVGCLNTDFRRNTQLGNYPYKYTASCHNFPAYFFYYIFFLAFELHYVGLLVSKAT